MTVAEVLLQAKALTLEERVELIESLIALNAREEDKPQRSLFELRGIAKGAWKGVDIDAYINELRDQWDRDN